MGYDAGYSILKGYVSPRRRCRQPAATMRFVTAPGEQAQVDWGSLSYISAGGKQRRVWVLVMTMGWSRACYVELVAARRRCPPCSHQPAHYCCEGLVVGQPYLLTPFRFRHRIIRGQVQDSAAVQLHSVTLGETIIEQVHPVPRGDCVFGVHAE